MKAQIKSSIKRLLLKYSYQIQRVKSSKDDPIHLWDGDKQFEDIFKQIIVHTLVDKIRCFMIYQYAKQVAILSGDVAEVGVYKGGTAKLLVKTFEPALKTVHLFDTFSGMPPTDPNKDIYKEGDFGDITLESVKTFLQDCKNVCLYPGLFPQSIPDSLKKKKFCMVHIDVDIYKSVMNCCEFFYPRLEKSGIMIFDDYGFPLCPGAKTAVDDFFLKKTEKPFYLPTGQCIITRS